MAINRVDYGGRTLIDLSSDTVTPDTLADGITAHNAAGEIITGVMLGGYGDVPSYHFVEAARVAALIDSFKTKHKNNIIFGAVSDIHVKDTLAATKTSVRNAAFGLEMVGAMVGCDFIAHLGDNSDETHIDPTQATASSPCGLENAKYSLNAFKSAFARLTRFNLVGNHDKTNDTQLQFDLIGSYNQFDDYGRTQIRGYGYKDFTDKKVRVIALNTCDYLNSSGGCAMSYEQKDFLMRSLDLSAKSNASQWQILLLSHIPLDWNGGDYNFYPDLQAILKAYENGTTATISVNTSFAKNETPSNYPTYSSGKLVYNYSGKNVAKLIGNIHGHVHTNKVSKIANTEFARVATPNTNPNGNKSESYPTYGDYSISDTEAGLIVKQSGSARDTSATFYCIDLNEQKIYSYGYGADIDREILYKTFTKYFITYSLTNCTSSNTESFVLEDESFSTEIIVSSGMELGAITVTMGGVDITSSVVIGSSINIKNVTGNVVITAVAEAPLITETITPHIAPRSTWYGGLTSSKLTLNSSNTEGALGVSTANSYAYTDRNSKKFYLMPIDSKYCKATLNYSATDGKAVRYYLQAIKINGSTYSSVATVGKGTNNVITWTAGAANYLLISIEHTDGTTKWDWNSAGKTITVTFSNK